MGKMVCIANWSEGRNLETISLMRRAINDLDLTHHYFEADIDHNRLVTAFSATPELLRTAVARLCDVAFNRIDMSNHAGVHPRIGALDVCPFVVLENSIPQPDALAFVRDLAQQIASQYDLPAFLYEHSETGKHAADLPELRKGQYEGLLHRTLVPDFGPTQANPKLGASVFGLRDWLIAMNVNLKTPDETIAKEIATQIRKLRDSDSRFAGVRALGFPLHSRQQSQVSLNLTRPDLTPVDPIIEWIADEAKDRRTKAIGNELIGVIHRPRLKTATRLNLIGRQVLD